VPSPKETFLRALDELSAAKQRNDELGIRQAAEKAWLAVVGSTDLFLLREHNLRVSGDDRSRAERRRFLQDVNQGDLARTYRYLAQTLHGDIFYLGEPVTAGQMSFPSAWSFTFLTWRWSLPQPCSSR
jgi:hypothetical protein